MSFEKCSCAHCGQHIEYPSEGRGLTVRCPTCNNPVVLTSSKPFTMVGPISVPVAPIQQQKQARTRLGGLTQLTIRKKTRSGETPLHRAAKLSKFSEVPRHLLETELFIAQDSRGETPLHVAAQHGSLNQVALEFLTRETLTVQDNNGNNPLHTAAYCDHADQIPGKFLTLEFLGIPTRLRYGGETRDGDTLLHILAGKNQLGLIPSDCFAPEMWSLKNHYGQTPRDILANAGRREAWRDDPATAKQKEKLHYFGCTWESEITKGEASNAITECIRRFPQMDTDYYNRPATDPQLAKLRPYLRANKESPDDYAAPGKPLTYGEAKELISECETEERSKLERKQFDELAGAYVIDVDMWAEIYPGLTWKRVQTAAKALDESRPGWRQEKNDLEIMIAEVAELYPKLGDRWRENGAISS